MSHTTSNAAITAAWLREWEQRFAEHVETVPADTAHDPEHVRRVVRQARRLAEIEGADLAVVIPAAWLHDCVHVPKSSPQRSQASRLAAMEAVRLLREWDYPEGQLDAIAHAIEAHSYSAGVTPRTIEAKVVQDADRLDALGAVGLARCLMLGAAMARPLYEPTDPFCEHRAPDDSVSCIDHLYTKLFRLAGTMQTSAGREEAERRTRVLHDYVAALAREIA
jgi:uncharacterized protein